MKKLKWTGTETEFLEFMMFVDTILYELSEWSPNFRYPTITQSARLLERFIEVNYINFSGFFDLKMNGRADGLYFHRLLRMRKLMQWGDVFPST